MAQESAARDGTRSRTRALLEVISGKSDYPPSSHHAMSTPAPGDAPPAPTLTPAQKTHFLTHGFLPLPACFSRAASAAFSAALWPRLGMSPTDKSTWHTERINMPSSSPSAADAIASASSGGIPTASPGTVPIASFAPKAWAAICELLGGESRISETSREWRDSFIVNLGVEGQGAAPARELDGWHVDGDFFVHFLDSPEQALLVIPLFSDIAPGGGGTAICTDGIGVVARHLYENPAGVTPWMHPRGTPEPTGPLSERLAFLSAIVRDRARASDASFHEMTGEVGDVYLLHPLMVHSATKNAIRVPRVITNPPVALKEPFRLVKEEGREFSLVEQKTLRELGFPEGLPGGWEIEGGREWVVPMRIKIQEEMRQKEQERLRLASQECK
ncbi:hypothetical protein B0H12DRAFT_442708 [Mycena haematopus]|nr:hypothetical protein B0H12DRAFT_442708 [Mycena haematopus]